MQRLLGSLGQGGSHRRKEETSTLKLFVRIVRRSSQAMWNWQMYCKKSRAKTHVGLFIHSFVNRLVARSNINLKLLRCMEYSGTKYVYAFSASCAVDDKCTHYQGRIHSENLLLSSTVTFRGISLCTLKGGVTRYVSK